MITLHLFLLVSLESNPMETEDLGVKMEMEDVTSALTDVTIDNPGKPVFTTLWKLSEKYFFVCFYWNVHVHSFVSTLVVSLFIYLSAYRFATFVMHDVTRRTIL